MAESVFSNIRVRGTLAAVGVATLAAVTLSNTLTLQDVVNFTPDGTSTGVVIQVNGTTQHQIFSTACTNTGGLAKYPTCYARSPLSTTGALKAVSLECGNTNKALTMSGGFVKSTTAAVADAFDSLNDVSIGTGAFASFNVRATSGSYVLWNPADAIKFQTVTAMPTGGIDCVVRAELYDKYGN